VIPERIIFISRGISVLGEPFKCRRPRSPGPVFTSVHNKPLFRFRVYGGPITSLPVLNMESDSWVKIDQLDVTCFIISFFNAQHVLDVNTSILRSLRLICWVISWVVLLCCTLQKAKWFLLWNFRWNLQPTSLKPLALEKLAEIIWLSEAYNRAIQPMK